VYQSHQAKEEVENGLQTKMPGESLILPRERYGIDFYGL
jgi:hypothetical protein